MIKRDYYKLKQAAEILECSEDDLIHYGARNKIKICVLRGDYHVVSQRVDLFDEQPIDDEHYQFDNEPLQLSRNSLIWLEEGSENAFAYIPTKTIWTENHGRPLEKIKYHLKHRRHNETPKVQDLIMVIMADELERFQNLIHKKTASTPDKTIDYLSRDLNILMDAAYQWWSSVDSDGSIQKYPNNKEVSEWLKKQGFSQINARQGAVIIRPEWAKNK